MKHTVKNIGSMLSKIFEIHSMNFIPLTTHFDSQQLNGPLTYLLIVLPVWWNLWLTLNNWQLDIRKIGVSSTMNFKRGLTLSPSDRLINSYGKIPLPRMGLIHFKLIVWSQYYDGAINYLGYLVPNKTDTKEEVAYTTIYTDSLYVCGNYW